MKVRLWLCIGLLVSSALCLREAVYASQTGLYIRVCQTGQGDASILRTPSGKVIVIDGGPNVDVLTDLSEVLPWFKRSIDLLVLTHPDADHITAVPSILRRYRVQAVLMTGIEHTSGRHDELVALLKQHNVPIITPRPNQVLDFGDGVVVRTLWPTTEYFGTKPDDANHTSVVLRTEFNNQSMLFTGDIDAAAEAAIVASGQSLESNYLKVAHHGSTTSSSTGFLLAVNPAMAIVSVGKHNKFNHPDPQIIERFAYFAIPLWNTAEQGDFEVIFR